LATGFERPEKCFQCGRCTSSCTISKVLKDYRPSRIVSSVRLGLTERMLNDTLWNCARCLKCVEYCPQKVAPADLILSLQFLAVSKGLTFPEAYEEMLRNLSETGLAFKQLSVVDREFETYTRESLNLPPLMAEARRRKIAEVLLKIGKGEL